jgi:hypothetical protein
VCDPTDAEVVANPGASEYRYDDNNVCKLSECSSRYTMSADLTKCNAKPKETTSLVNCSQLFEADSSGSCYDPGRSAGIRWNWGDTSDANTQCNKKLKYYEVTVKSNADTSQIYRTKLSPGSSTAGVAGLPPTFMDTDLTFTVDPYDTNGDKVLDRAKEFIVKKGTTTKCGDVGVITTDAFMDWNENDNLRNYQRYTGAGGWASYWAKFNGKVLWDSGQNETEGTRHSFTVPKGTVIGSSCRYGGGRDYPGEPLETANRRVRLLSDCWASRNNQWLEYPGEPGPKKSPL